MNTEMLKQKLDGSGLKRGFIAQELSLSTYGFARKVDGITEFKPSEIRTLMRLLSLTDDDVREIFFGQ